MVNKQYIFIAGADACGSCAALDGTISDAPLGPQHENCHCQSEPVTMGDDCPTVEIDGISIRTDGGSTTVGADVTVHCCDESEVGLSMNMDLGPVSLSIEDIVQQFEVELAIEASALITQGCPEGIDVWVEDGEEEGLV